jgi:hypothetical protein
MSAPTEAPRPKAVLVGVQLSGVADAEQRSSLKEWRGSRPSFNRWRVCF